MTIVVRTNGDAVRAYVGTKRVHVAPDGSLDPIERALAQLRIDCEADRRRLMADFRWWADKASDVFGRREAQWQTYLAHIHEQREHQRAAEAAALAARRAEQDERDQHDFGRRFPIYDDSVTITSEVR